MIEARKKYNNFTFWSVTGTEQFTRFPTSIRKVPTEAVEYAVTCGQPFCDYSSLTLYKL